MDDTERNFIQTYLDARAAGVTHAQAIAACPHPDVAEAQLKKAGIGGDSAYDKATREFLTVYRRLRANGAAHWDIMSMLPNPVLAEKQIRAAGLLGVS